MYLARFYLNPRKNQLTSFPTELGKLKKLSTLDLKGNPIKKSEKQKIKKLLPNCQIPF